MILKLNIIIRRPKYNGKGKFDLENEKFYITHKCDINIPHNQLDYETISHLIDNNQIDEIDFSLKKNQKLVVEYIFNKLKKENNIDIKKEFTKYTKYKFLLSNVEVSKIKNRIWGKLNGLSLEDCIKKDPNYTLEINSIDLKCIIIYNLISIK